MLGGRRYKGTCSSLLAVWLRGGVKWHSLIPREGADSRFRTTWLLIRPELTTAWSRLVYQSFRSAQPLMSEAADNSRFRLLQL